MRFRTEVNGTPCICRVVSHTASSPMEITGWGFGDCEPPDPGEFEYELYHLDDTPAPELEELVTDDDDERLEREYLKRDAEQWSDV